MSVETEPEAAREAGRADASNVAAISVKIPPFWPSDPQVWFAQVEAQFSMRGITAQPTKFDYIVASLSPEFATEVRDLILQFSTHPYATLKEQLIRRTAASEQRRFQQLITTEELGDRRPSQLLRRIQQLLGDSAAATDGTFVRELFLQRLPANVRMVLASTGDTVSIEELAELADKIVEVATPAISGITAPPLREVEQLRAEVSRLADLVTSLSIQGRKPRGRSPSPSRTRTTGDDPVLCWYHQRFGDSARWCRSPCSRSGNDQASR